MTLGYLPLVVALIALLIAVERLVVLQFSRSNIQPSASGTFALFGLAAASLCIALLDHTFWGDQSIASLVSWAPAWEHVRTIHG